MHELLSIVITLAEQLHFRKTSEHYHMSVSTLTKMIQRLESTLGTQLFERSNRSVKLTEHGRLYYEFAKQTRHAYEQLLLDIHEESPEKIHGDIKLFSTITAAYHILPSLIKAFRKHYPLTMTYLETGLVKLGLDHLRAGTVDFSIGILSDRQLLEFDCIKILETPLIFIGPKWFKTQDITTCPLIIPESGDLAKIINQYIADHMLTVSIHSYVEGHEAILALVSAGLGAAILPEIVVKNSHLKSSIQTFPLPHALPVLDVAMFKKKKINLSPAKQAFWEFTQTHTHMTKA